MLRKLFRIKPLDLILRESENPEHQLRRAIGPIQLTLFGIGAIIGAGIFATIGTAAAGDAFRPGAGPALMISFVITAVVCAFTALCYAEFASMVPISGSAYTYSYATLGEVVAWIIGWDLIIEYAVGNIAVAISWANYFKTFLKGFGLHVPDWLSMDYRTASRLASAGGSVFQEAPRLFGIPIVFNLLAVGIVAAITLILVRGIRESSRFNAVMVVIKLVVLGFFVFIGLKWIQPANWTPFAPNGWAGISAGAAVVFFAYIGFDAVSTVAEETINPKKNLPIGIIGSLIVCTIVYAIVSAIFTGLISYPDLKMKLATEQAEPLTMALSHVSSHLGWAVGIVAFGSIIAHTAVLLVFQLGQPRIFFSMARDGLLPQSFYAVHPKYRTPHIATILTGVFVAAFAAIASIDEMVDLTNIGTLFAFILVCAGIIVLRIKDPDRPRPFRVPGGWRWTIPLYTAFAIGVWFLPMGATGKYLLVFGAAPLFVLFRNHIFPVLGIACCSYLIYYLPPLSWLRFAAWLNFGILVYVLYGSVHSRMTGRHLRNDHHQHDAETAFTGSWLGAAGTLMLFLTRGFDIWTAGVKRGEGFASLLHIKPWFQTSWFLLIPFLLNLLVLYPIVIRRSLLAKRSGGREIRLTKRGLGLSAVVIGLMIAYLIRFLIIPAR